MRAEFPIFPLIFMLTIVVAIATTFMLVLSLSNEIGDQSAGQRAATMIELYEMADDANRYLETAVLVSTREAVADRFRTNRYPCTVSGRFGIFDETCGSTEYNDEAYLESTIEEKTDSLLATHRTAFFAPIELMWDNSGTEILISAVSEDVVVFPSDASWRDHAFSETFNRSDAPVHSTRISVKANVHSIVDPLLKNRSNHDQVRVAALVESALADEQTYCEADLFKDITAMERLVDIIDACPEVDDACSCGTIELSDLTVTKGWFVFKRTQVSTTFSMSGSSVVLSNEDGSTIDFPTSRTLTDSEFDLNGDRYVVLMNESNISLVDRNEVGSINPCRIGVPKINVFSTVPIVIDTELNCRDPTNEGATCQERGGSTVTTSDIFGLDADRVAIYDRSADYASWLPIYTSSPTESQGISREEAEDARLQAMDEISGRFFDNAVRENGMNIFLVTHDDAEETRGSAMRYATSEESGLPVTIDSMLTGLYPAPEARIESIIEEIDISDLEETCRDRLGDIQILRDPYRVRDVLVPQTEFFAPFVEAEYPYVIISIPRSYIDECADEGSLDFASDERGKRIQEIVLKAAVRASIIHSSAMPSGRLLCLDDSVPLATRHPFLGYSIYDIYPYVIVPEPPSGFVWPLEDVGTFTQCWGPPTDPWAFDREGNEIPAPYTYHRGLDLQPTGGRENWSTIWERFTEGYVVSIAPGEIVYSSECPFSPFFGQGSVSSEELLSTAEQMCGKVNGVAGDHYGSGFGEHLVIDHGEFYALYGHLAPGSIYEALGKSIDKPQPVSGNNFDRYTGTPVSAGQRIGIVGNTGTSTGAHLHFEIYRKDDARIDPGTKRPKTPAGGYAPSAADFIQFNPFCVLPREVTLDDGSSYDIIDRLPQSSGIDRNPPPTDAFDGDEASVVSTDESAVESSDGFVRPANDVVMCLNNYWQAYLDYNPLSDTYGVCP